MSEIAYVGMGSNMGDRRAMLCRALSGMTAFASTWVRAVSSIYETAPWGMPDQPAFLNCAAMLETELEPVALLQELLGLETRLGRVREIHWGPRVIDLDLLFYDRISMDTEFLTLPHPLIAARPFVLVPLLELRVDLTVHGVSLSDHLEKLPRTAGDVVLWSAPPTRNGDAFV